MSEQIKSVEDPNLEMGKLVKLAQEIADRQESISSLDQEQLAKISAASEDCLKKFNDAELKRKDDEAKIKSLEEKQESFERELSRGSVNTTNATEVKKLSFSSEQFKCSNAFLRSDEEGYRNSLRPQLKEINFNTTTTLLKHFYPHLNDNKLAELTRKYWVEGDDTRGGYLVRPELATRFIKRDLNSASIRPWVNVFPMSSPIVPWIIDDDISIRGVWEGELGNVPVQNTAVIGQANLVAKQLKVNVPVSHEFMQDAFVDVESYIADKLDLRFMLSENEATINGTGVKELKGILQYDDWSAPGVYTQDAIERVFTETANTITYDDIVNISTALPGIYRPNAAWFMSRSAWGSLLKIKGTDGQPLLKPMEGFREGFSGATLMGYPVIILDQLAQWTGSTIPTDAEPIILGDFKRSIALGDRLLTSLVRDIYTDDSVTKFKARRRMGLLVTSFDGMKILKISAP